MEPRCRGLLSNNPEDGAAINRLPGALHESEGQKFTSSSRNCVERFSKEIGNLFHAFWGFGDQFQNLLAIIVTGRMTMGKSSVGLFVAMMSGVCDIGGDDGSMQMFVMT